MPPAGNRKFEVYTLTNNLKQISQISPHIWSVKAQEAKNASVQNFDFTSNRFAMASNYSPLKQDFGAESNS